jgi:2-hydroxychromene-2-carboxylate isomerase
MPAPIDFYFDFSSPYGYLASERIDALAAKYGRKTEWHPMLLGAAFKETGMAPLTAVPLKGDYSRLDFARSARYRGLEFRMPEKFPIPTQTPARIMLWLKSTDPARAVRVAHGFFRAYFVEGTDISDTDSAIAVAAKHGVDRAAARAAITDPAVKDALKREVDRAIARGVFGSPFVFIDDEPFWGFDRLDQIEHWLAKGGF